MTVIQFSAHKNVHLQLCDREQGLHTMEEFPFELILNGRTFPTV